ncbi:hypothetical protein [Arthrobacter sp. SDTb3-6]|uniref:hypothetical protein n=1 Tax=Arthrobacter sp. SDTb3-6 TaxID=2713571 RepID=UPI00159DD018|nr:hypothetical protein [Arthrobacter sp. SDTb3-6]NVM99263.1 hypothetical protein [Arthrobacter sp. SDTb3-6]
MSPLDGPADAAAQEKTGRAQHPAGLRSTARESGAPWAARYRYLLWASDIIVLAAVLLLASFLRFGAAGGHMVLGPLKVDYVHLSFAVAVLWLAILSAYRSRDARVVGIGLDEYRRVTSATVSVLGTMAMLALAFELEVARGYIGLALPLGIAGLLVSRWGLRQWLTRQRQFGHFLSRVIVLGRRGDVEYVIGQIQKKSGAAYEVIGAALPEGNRKKFLEVGGQGIPVVASILTAVKAVERLNADAVIVAGPVNRGSKFLQRLGWDLEGSATGSVVLLPVFAVVARGPAGMHTIPKGAY